MSDDAIPLKIEKYIGEGFKKKIWKIQYKVLTPLNFSIIIFIF